MNRHPPSSFGEEPPAYDNEAASFLSHDDSPTAPSRHNGPSMRLLPTSSNVDSDLSGSYRPVSPSQYSHYPSEYAETSSPYVSTHLLIFFPSTCNANGLQCEFIPRHIPDVVAPTQSYPLWSPSYPSLDRSVWHRPVLGGLPKNGPCRMMRDSFRWWLNQCRLTINTAIYLFISSVPRHLHLAISWSHFDHHGFDATED
jgi:hypothetical protein